MMPRKIKETNDVKEIQLEKEAEREVFFIIM